MSGKASVGGPGGDTAQEEILRKLDDTAAQRQIDIGGGVMVNVGQEEYGNVYGSVYRTVVKLYYNTILNVTEFDFR